MTFDPTTRQKIRMFQCDGTPDGRAQEILEISGEFKIDLDCPCGDALQLVVAAGWSAKRGLFVDLKEPAKRKKGP